MVIKFPALAFLLTSIGKSKLIIHGSVTIKRFLLSSNYTPIVITTWSNSCKVFCWFYYTDTKDIVFVRFCFLVSMNYFQLLLVLAILKNFLELIFWFLFILLLPHHLLLMALMIYVMLFLSHYLLML